MDDTIVKESLASKLHENISKLENERKAKKKQKNTPVEGFISNKNILFTIFV